MNIHIVRKPFMSRKGQFEPGLQSLCIGLDMNALRSTKEYRCYLGKNRKAYYEIDTKYATEYAQEHNSIWTNPKGKRVAILPLKEFVKKLSGWDKDEFEAKEIKRAKLAKKVLYK